MPTLTAPDEVVEEEVLEEVVVEPDLPVEAPYEGAPPLEEEIAESFEDLVEPPGKEHYNRLLAAMAPDEPVYVAGTRAPRLKVGNYVLSPGEVVPGAHHWPRRETYERLGRIERL